MGACHERYIVYIFINAEIFKSKSSSAHSQPLKLKSRFDMEMEFP